MAPTVLRTRNLRICVYPHDHGPPHVHVIGPGGEAKFALDDCSCVFARGLSPRLIRKLSEFISANRDILIEAWNEFQK